MDEIDDDKGGTLDPEEFKNLVKRHHKLREAGIKLFKKEGKALERRLKKEKIEDLTGSLRPDQLEFLEQKFNPNKAKSRWGKVRTAMKVQAAFKGATKKQEDSDAATAGTFQEAQRAQALSPGGRLSPQQRRDMWFPQNLPEGRPNVHGAAQDVGKKPSIFAPMTNWWNGVTQQATLCGTMCTGGARVAVEDDDDDEGGPESRSAYKDV